jgi:hypothetical protein
VGTLSLGGTLAPVPSPDHCPGRSGADIFQTRVMQYFQAKRKAEWGVWFGLSLCCIGGERIYRKCEERSGLRPAMKARHGGAKAVYIAIRRWIAPESRVGGSKGRAYHRGFKVGVIRFMLGDARRIVRS